MNKHLQRMSADLTPSSRRPLSVLFNRFYWLQVVLIASAVILGIACSAMIVKNLLIKTAMEQEDAHYWQRYDINHNAELPDTKNLYGYRWRDTPPPALRGRDFQVGVHRLYIDGAEHVTHYNVHDGDHLLLVFGESNVNRLVWLFGLAPLMASLILLYSMLWWVNRKARRHLSPVTQLAQTLHQIDLSHPNRSKGLFGQIDTRGNLEAEDLKHALDKYHQTLIEFIEREQQFTAEVSHELRTPLSVIKGGVELLSYKYPDDTTLPRMANVIRDMQQLMETLLTIARQGSAAPLQLEPFDLAAQMQRSCSDLDELFKARQMDYDIKVINPNHALTNPTLVSMIFGNLLRNALNYSQGKRVYILIDSARIVIEDDGVGLTTDALEALRGHASSNLIPHKGFGIGLKLVKRLCDMLGWHIELINKASLNHHANIMQSNEGLAVVIYTAS